MRLPVGWLVFIRDEVLINVANAVWLELRLVRWFFHITAILLDFHIGCSGLRQMNLRGKCWRPSRPCQASKGPNSYH